MARYIDMDKLGKMIEVRAEQLIEGKEALLYVAKWLNLLPEADVVPKIEVERWKQINEQLHKEMSERMMEERKIERKLVAREILDEVESLFYKTDFLDGLGYVEFEIGLAELEKKYTEGE